MNIPLCFATGSFLVYHTSKFRVCHTNTNNVRKSTQRGSRVSPVKTLSFKDKANDLKSKQQSQTAFPQ